MVDIRGSILTYKTPEMEKNMAATRLFGVQGLEMSPQQWFKLIGLREEHGKPFTQQM